MSVASNPIAKMEPLPPHEYVIVVRTQRCDCCGATHKWSETYALSPLKPRLGLGRAGLELTRIHEPRYRVPITKRNSALIERVPFCHSCYEPSLANTANLEEIPSPEESQRILNSTLTPLAEHTSGRPSGRTPERERITPTQIAELLK